jgi:ketopantoate reductase
MSNVTIVGGSGAIGLTHAWLLSKAGHTVTILDSRPDGNAGKSFSRLSSMTNIKISFSTAGKFKNNVIASQNIDRKVLSHMIEDLPKGIPELIFKELRESAQIDSELVINAFNRALTMSIDEITLAQNSNQINQEQDVIITTTKNGALTKSLAEKILKIPISSNSPVVVFANGIMPWIIPEKDFGGLRLQSNKNIHDFIDCIGPERVKGGVLIRYGSSVQPDGNLNISMLENSHAIVGNSNNNIITKDLFKVVELYSDTGLSLEIGDITKPLIKKLGLNIGIAMFSAIFNVTDFKNIDKSLENSIRLVAREYFSFSKRLGVSLAKTSQAYEEEQISWAKNMSGAIPSVLKDLREGLATEKAQYLDALCELCEKNMLDIPNLKSMKQLFDKVEVASKEGLSNLQSAQESAFNDLKRNRGNLKRVSLNQHCK